MNLIEVTSEKGNDCTNFLFFMTIIYFLFKYKLSNPEFLYVRQKFGSSSAKTSGIGRNVNGNVTACFQA